MELLGCKEDSNLFSLKKKKYAPPLLFNVFIQEASHIQNSITKIPNH